MVNNNIDIEGIILLSKSQKKEAERIFSLSFEDYPLFSAFFSGNDERKKKIPYFFRFILRYGMKYGLVTTTPNLEGAAIFFPPDKIKMTLWRLVISGVNIFGRQVGFKNAMSVNKICDSFYESQEKLIPYPHWYLMFIAVQPALQGKGYARKLLNPVFEFLDKEHLPLYLETQDKKNVEVYQKMGFKLIETSSIPGFGIENYCMVREI